MAELAEGAESLLTTLRSKDVNCLIVAVTEMKDTDTTPY